QALSCADERDLGRKIWQGAGIEVPGMGRRHNTENDLRTGHRFFFARCNAHFRGNFVSRQINGIGALTANRSGNLRIVNPQRNGVILGILLQKNGQGRSPASSAENGNAGHARPWSFRVKVKRGSSPRNRRRRLAWCRATISVAASSVPKLTTGGGAWPGAQRK